MSKTKDLVMNILEMIKQKVPIVIICDKLNVSEATVMDVYKIYMEHK